MANITQKVKKETGATFTPPKLANLLADKLLQYFNGNNREITVLDPSCGDGALLKAVSKKLLTTRTDFQLLGYDLNNHFLDEASNILSSMLNPDCYNLLNEDFLDAIDLKPLLPELFSTESESTRLNDTVDLIIANPPYVRTQILGSDYSQRIAKKFSLKGRVDLYYPFLIAMTHALKKDGVLSVVTSNRYLTTKSGISIRKFLERNFEILEILDLGDTKLFDAAVLPAIFVGRKKSNPTNLNSKFTKIYEQHEEIIDLPQNSEDIYEVLVSKSDGLFDVDDKVFKKTTGKIYFTKTKDSNWNLLNSEEESWIEAIKENSTSIIADHFKVRVGIKTTADKVFISEDWNSKDIVPESELLHDLISQQNIQQWSINNNKNLRVLYPYDIDEKNKKVVDLSSFPKSKDYFESHFERLSSRKYLIEAGRNWFEIWVPHNPYSWRYPKLVFPDISPYPRFYFDNTGKIVNGNCYWISSESEDKNELLLLLQGICNSDLMTKYHDLMFNNKLYSGRRRYFSQFVEKYPLPDLSSDSCAQIIALVKNLNVSEKQETEMVKELEIHVQRAYGLQ